jgi:FMN phosphatase YigB (HAD superfamily)
LFPSGNPRNITTPAGVNKPDAAGHISWDFDRVISATDGACKPDPAVYRRAAGLLQLEVADALI